MQLRIRRMADSVPSFSFEDCEDSDFDEDDSEASDPEAGTSVLEARNGKDIQGIPWNLFNYPRDRYRQTRLKQYKNYESLYCSRQDIQKEYKVVEKGKSFYDFQFSTKLVEPTIGHFQLRNLLWSTSKNDVYLRENYSVKHWSAFLKREEEVLDVVKPLVPTVKTHGSYDQPLSRVLITTMAVKDNLMVAGGLEGELICKYLNQPEVAFCTKTTADDNGINTAVDIWNSPNGSINVMTANNDARVRVFDAQNFACLNIFTFPWSVNNTSVSPDGKMLAVVGDSPECLITDAQSGKVINNLKGHLDYSFASAWHPNGQILATGNQDTTCRIWDIRNMSSSLAVLKGRMGSIRVIKFTSDGQFMAMAENADFVHIFDTRSDYAACQEIDFFGEIGGISFSPDTEALFIGIADRMYGCLLEYNRRRYNHYLDFF